MAGWTIFTSGAKEIFVPDIVAEKITDILRPYQALSLGIEYVAS